VTGGQGIEDNTPEVTAELAAASETGSRAGHMMYRIPLVFTPQPKGGYTVTSPVLPELLTEGDTLEETHANVRDAFEAVAELYAEAGRALPTSISQTMSAPPKN